MLTMNKQNVGYAVGIICAILLGIFIAPYVQPPVIELVPWIIEEAGEPGGVIRLYLGQRVEAQEGREIYVYYLGTTSLGDSYFKLYQRSIIDYLGTTSLGDSYFKLYQRSIIEHTIVIHGVSGFKIEGEWAYYYEVDVTAFGKDPSPWVELTISDRIYYPD